MSTDVRAIAVRGDSLTKVLAFFERDFKLAISYSTAFWLGWVGVLVDVVVAFFLGSLVAPSSRFGWDGKPHPYFDYLVVNTAFLRFQSAAVQTFSLAIRDGQQTGTLECLISTPTSLGLIILSSGGYLIAYQIVQSFVYIGFAVLMGLHVAGADPVTIFVYLLLTVLAIVPIGVIAAAATMSFKKTGPVEFMFTAATQLFGGVYLPVSLLPGPLRWVGNLLPITHALNGLRAGLQGAPLWATGVDLVWLVGVTAVVLPASLVLFSTAVGRARADGTLGQY